MMGITKEQASLYKRRWGRVAKAQTLELRGSVMPLRFKQLCFLMNSFHFKSVNRETQNGPEKVRQRWLMLKAQWRKRH